MLRVGWYCVSKTTMSWNALAICSQSSLESPRRSKLWRPGAGRKTGGGSGWRARDASVSVRLPNSVRSVLAGVSSGASAAEFRIRLAMGRKAWARSQ